MDRLVHIVVLKFRGSEVNYPNVDAVRKTAQLMTSFEKHTLDALAGLNLFELNNLQPQPEHPMDVFREASEMERLGTDPAEARHIAFMKRWNQGTVPREVARRLSFVHARTFLSALDGIHRTLEQLKEIAETSALATGTLDRFEIDFPDLREVRNSIQHEDERRLLIGPKKNAPPITPLPYSAPGFRTIGLALDNLVFRRYTTMLGDGRQGSVEVSIDSLQKATRCIQDFLDALPWKEPARARYSPSW